jgi:hypothetical protein
MVAGTLSMPEAGNKPVVPARNEAVRKANGKARFHQLESLSPGRPLSYRARTVWPCGIPAGIP